MSSSFRVPYINYDQTRLLAKAFLSKHHPSLSIPVPIEKIIDNNLRLNIVPIPGILDDLKEAGMDIAGFISADLSDIYIDHYIYHSLSNLFRFTLAHEIGHSILHKTVYDQKSFASIDEYLDFIVELQGDDDNFKWYELQAHNFAGLVLVPEQQLNESVQRQVLRFKTEAKARGFSFSNENEIWSFLYEELAEEFQVSTSVIEKRVRFDQLKDRYKLI